MGELLNSTWYWVFIGGLLAVIVVLVVVRNRQQS